MERQNTKPTLEMSLPSRIPFSFSHSMDDYLYFSQFPIYFLFVFLLVEDLFFFFFPPLPVDLNTISGKYLWTCGSRSSLAIQQRLLLQCDEAEHYRIK